MPFSSLRTALLRFSLVSLALTALIASGSPDVGAQGPDPVREKLSPLLRSLLHQVETPSDPGSPDFTALQRGRRQRLEALATRVSLDPSVTPPMIDVLVEFEGQFPATPVPGGRVVTRRGSYAVVELPIAALRGLAHHPAIVRAEEATIEFPANDVAGGAPSTILGTGARLVQQQFRLDGAGTLVAIIDSGIDLFHLDFRSSSTAGTRVRALFDAQAWDEADRPADTTPFVYTRAEIDAFLANPGGAPRVPPTDPTGHGTHVAGAAVGDGSARANGEFRGVAPAAEIIFVRHGGGLTRFELMEGLNFIEAQAAAAGLPVVINSSSGTDDGAHDGTSVREGVLEDELGPMLFVASAGNERNKAQHASGNLSLGATETYTFQVPAGSSEITLQVWYDALNRFQLGLRSQAAVMAVAADDPVPLGTAAAQFSLLTQEGITSGLGFANDITVMHLVNDPTGRANRMIQFEITAGSSPSGIQSGLWTVELRHGQGAPSARYDSWLVSSDDNLRFLSPDLNRTVTIPATSLSANVLAVGSFTSRRLQAGEALAFLSDFSSIGPTRDNRLKPDLVAPGEWIVSSQALGTAIGLPFVAGYRAAQGTSFAAPQVAGAAALLLQIDPTLTAVELANILRDNTGKDILLGTVPNFSYGQGRLDIEAAVNSLATIETDFDGFTNLTEVFVGTRVTSNCGVLAWPADFNDSTGIDILDIILLLNKQAANESDPNYDRRFDIVPDFMVGSLDIDREIGVHGSLCGGAPLAGPEIPVRAARVQVLASEATVQRGEVVEVTLVVADASDLRGFQAQIHYDPEVLTLIDVGAVADGLLGSLATELVQIDSGLETPQGLQVRGVPDSAHPGPEARGGAPLDEDGVFQVAAGLSGTETVDGDGVLVTLRFRAQGAGVSTISVEPVLPGSALLVDGDVTGFQPSEVLSATVEVE